MDTQTKNQEAQTTTVPTAAVVVKKDVVDGVLAKVTAFKESGELKIPKDYSPENALKSAWLILQEAVDRNNKPVLQVCTKESIANALLKMVVLGLSPLKKQGDFIPYGTSLTFQEEYTGNIALAKRYGNLKSIKANAIFKGDEFVFEVGIDGRKRILKHEQKLEHIGGEVVGAYAVTELTDGTIDTEIMSISQIKNAWNQGAMKGGSPAHKNFSDQMAIKTVINRACKPLIRGSNDVVLLDDDDKDFIADARNNEIVNDGNRKEIVTEEVPFEEVKPANNPLQPHEPTQEQSPVEQKKIPF